MKTEQTLHIVAFDVPYPANYGGVIDIYHKIRALHDVGVSITLHCFEYGRQPAAELEKLCRKVFYYPRKTFMNFLIGNMPYIVASRESSELLANLTADNAPILFEGLHTTFYLKHPLLKHRLKLVRTHNIEHDYYKHLEAVEKNFFKRYFFKLESEKLKKYQFVLRHADIICAISPKDAAYFQKKFGKTILLPAFHSNDHVRIREGTGDYVLYHGNLSVGENHQAAMYLISHVFSKLKLPFIIAGSHPRKELRQLAAQYDHIRLTEDGDTAHIHELIRNAQINILYTDQDTGIKLKLLNSLFNGRHCVVNPKMVMHTGLEPMCHLAQTDEEFINLTQSLFNTPFTPAWIKERTDFLNDRFNNQVAAGVLLDAINGHVQDEHTQSPVKQHGEKTVKPKRKQSLASFLGLIP